MDALLHVIETYGLWVVFLCVLLDQGGLPVPAYPPMIVTSALAVETRTPVWPILLVAIAATVAADLLWYAGGVSDPRCSSSCAGSRCRRIRASDGRGDSTVAGDRPR